MDNKQDQFGLNKFGEFRNRGIESDFMAQEKKNYSKLSLILTLIIICVFVLYLVMMYIQKNNEPGFQLIIAMLFTLAVFHIHCKWKISIFAGCSIIIIYILFCAVLLESSGPPSIAQRGICLGICLASCAIFLYEKETSKRKNYATEQLLKILSFTDKLTGIYNRCRFEYLLGLWIKNMRHDPFCVLFIDLDNFKRVNDIHGHYVGDQVLIETTEVITANIRDDDIFARWGGEEFVVLYASTTLERATEFAERLRKAVEAHVTGEAGNITISIGVAKYRRGESLTDFVGRADAKMYEAKQAGKNRVVAET